MESTSIIVLILTKDHNSVTFDHVTFLQVFAIGYSCAIDVEVPNVSGVLPRCADVTPITVIAKDEIRNIKREFRHEQSLKN